MSDGKALARTQPPSCVAQKIGDPAEHAAREKRAAGGLTGGIADELRRFYKPVLRDALPGRLLVALSRLARVHLGSERRASEGNDVERTDA